MRKSIIFLCFLLIPFSGISKKYTPFNFTNGQWNCRYFTKGGVFDGYGNDYVTEIVRFYCQGDTLINDTIFNKLYYVGYAKPTMTPQKNIAGYYGAIRNDSINKKVWLKNAYTYGVLYDFNLKVGDSIGYDCSNPFTTIISIDSVQYCNSFHNRYNFLDYQNNNQFIVEGIGSRLGLVPMNYLTSSSYLICYSEKNNYLCDTCDIPTNVNTIEKNQTNIFPNPSLGIVRVVSDNLIKSIKIIDMLGKEIYSDQFNNIYQIEINIQQTGVFIIEINTNRGKEIRKFIKK